MKNILLVMILIAFSSPAFSGHHESGDGLNLKKRQADAVMTVTNVDIGNNRLSEIQKIEAHENTLIGATEGIRVVLKMAPQNKSKIIL